MNVTVFDLEIKATIDKINVGWKDYDKMGISVGCSYNFQSDDYRLYFDDNMEELVSDLNMADMITGFNIIDFDMPLLRAHTKTELKPKTIYDMLKVSRESVGNFFAKGLRLDNHLESIFGKDGMKSGDGADAPGLWQRRELGKLSSYVLRDVNRERALFRHIWDHGWVSTAAHGKKAVADPKAILACGF